jgi:hypothetical protein
VLTPRVSVLKLGEKLQTAENDNSHNNGKPDRMTSASHLASTLRAVSPFGRCEFVASGAGEAYDARRQRSRAQMRIVALCLGTGILLLNLFSFVCPQTRMQDAGEAELARAYSQGAP